MAIGIEDKKAIVAEVNEVASGALSVVLADYHGVEANDMTNLRRQARDGGVYLRVVRNTLAKRAVDGTEFECIGEVLTGPTILAFSLEDPGAAARLLKDFAKEQKEFEIKALAVGGELLGADQIDRLAKMPTRDQALAMLAGVIQAPITKLVRTSTKFLRRLHVQWRQFAIKRKTQLNNFFIY